MPFGLEFFRIYNPEPDRVDSFIEAVVCAESEKQAIEIFLATPWAKIALQVRVLDKDTLKVEHIAAQPGIVVISER